MAKASFQIEDNAEDWVDSRLVPGQSRSAWYRYAVTTIMQVDASLDELYQPYEYEKRQEFIEHAVRKEIDRLQAEETDKSHDNIVDQLEEAYEE